MSVKRMSCPPESLALLLNLPKDELCRELIELRDEVARLSEELARQALERRRLQDTIGELTELSLRDALTGLYNRRGLLERLVEELARARRYASPLSLLMVDIDHFKRINDTHGHATGDMAISHVARILVRGRRISDIVARYGGEELVVLLPHTTVPGALSVAERLRTQIQSTPYRTLDGQDLLTVSIGVAEFEPSMRDPSDLLQAADRALYASKRSGRNRVSVANDAF